MLSIPQHRFSSYHSMSSPTLLSHNHVSQSHMHPSGLDRRSQGPHYALQNLQQDVGSHNQYLVRGSPQGKYGHHLFGGRSTSVNGPIRRRISRACDQCNQLRTKCNGQHPCAHCIGKSWNSNQSGKPSGDWGLTYSDVGLGCEYQRERKKRGKASRKDIAQKAAAQATMVVDDLDSPASGTENNQSIEQPKPKAEASTTDNKTNESETGERGDTRSEEQVGSIECAPDMPRQQLQKSGHPCNMEQDHLEDEASFDPNNYANIHHVYGGGALEAHIMNPAVHPTYSTDGCTIASYPDLSYGLPTQTSTSYMSNPATFPLAASPLSIYPISEDGPSPGWMDVPPPQQYQTQLRLPIHHSSQLRYPVLEPLVPHLGSTIPLSLACDLIDFYFSSSSSAQVHPMSPYVLGFVFRKRSFLHPSEPRRCQPALLASMLWVAAQTSDAPILANVPSARGKICRRLLKLTVGLLNPLDHTPSGGESSVSSPAAIDGVALGGLGVAQPRTISMGSLTSETGPFGAAGTLDDVVTYIHLATAVSASEYKSASLRWWNAAWSLARELRLGRELLHTMSAPKSGNEGGDKQSDGSVITEEEREERRRVWWLVYIVDRHLALCYNRPLYLLDIECDGLLQPMDDTAFQNGNFQPPAPINDPAVPASGPSPCQYQGRIRGPSFECRGYSIYGYFLPLMAILGEIVDLNHARNHPRFGVGFRSAREWDGQAKEIERHLGIYEKSLKKFAQRNMRPNYQNRSDDNEYSHSDDHGLVSADTSSVKSVHNVPTSASRMTESELQARIVVCYGTHVMHVLHILLTGKWDPINLFDDNDSWISSQGFIAATKHAVSAAEAASHILEYDAGLEFMPFFFGIYLLQGSFLLLLIADKKRSEASPSVMKACETIIRAHEACVVTLNTEYQVRASCNFNTPALGLLESLQTAG